MTLLEIIGELRTRNIRISVENHKIVLKDAVDRLPEHLLEKIRNHKQELMLFYEQASMNRENERKVMLADNDSYDLSHMQRNIWVDQKIHPDIPYYNVGSSWIIEGHVDEGRLRSAVEKIVAENEILRTGFPMENWEPRQKIASSVIVDWQYHDLNRKSDVEEQVSALIRAASEIIFDLEKPPLFKIFLIKENQMRFHLLFVIHHIIADGWSLKVFFDQILFHYTHTTNHESVVLPHANLQYKDFSSRQSRQAANEGFMISKRYWEDEFSDVPGFIFESKKGATTQTDYSGASFSAEINPVMRQSLRSRCAELNATPFITILSCIKIALFHFTQAKSVIVETGVIDREEDGLASQLGPYLSNIPIRVEVNEGISFSDFVGQVRSAFIHSLEHKTYPIHLIKKDQKKVKKHFTGLTNVSFTFHNEGLLHAMEIIIGELRIRKSAMPLTRVIKGMSIHAFENPGSLILNIDYSLELFDESFIIHFRDVLFNILNSALCNPKASVGEMLTLIRITRPITKEITFSK